MTLLARGQNHLIFDVSEGPQMRRILAGGQTHLIFDVLEGPHVRMY